jgi:ribonuclease E
MTRKKLGIGLLEAFSEPCEACAARGVIVHHEPILRTKHLTDGAGDGSRQERSSRRNRGNGNQRQEAAKVVTPERAVEINSVVAKIAASTVAAHEAAGEPSLISLAPAIPKVSGAVKSQSVDAQPEVVKQLEEVLESLPEPKGPGQGRRRPRRASSGGNVTVATTNDQ